MCLFFSRKIPLIMARTMWGPGVLWAAGAKVEVLGKSNVAPDTAYVFAANHQSFLDIACLFYAIPSNLYFIAKKEVMWMPFIGFFMWATGMIFVDRKNRERAIASMDRAGRLIKSGKNVLIFPEGTRSHDGQVKAFKKGAFMMAAKADLPIVPVAVSGTEVSMPAKSFKVTPHPVKVSIGAPISIGKEESIDDFIKSVRGTMIAMKQQID